ncbi:BUD13 [Cordylochernes scorpioides]|uniref:BUD13 homolog n=1 Tax=Cordylochernes scorpioides TaxID=51811 RepID=A0ABY6LMV6_9ARAC|nr:BUD13 [Cordylochernes scorpioides]
MNKQEFLKRYLSHNVKTEDEQKKEKRKFKKIRNIKIVDDDVDFRKVDTIDLELGEEAPIIIGDDPVTVASTKWKAIVRDVPEVKEEPRTSPSPPPSDGAPRKRMRHDSSGSDLSIPGRHGSQSPRRTSRQDSDNSPPRTSEDTRGRPAERRKAPSPVVIKKEPPDTYEPSTSRNKTAAGSDSDLSPPRSRQAEDSDLSPPRVRSKESPEKGTKVGGLMKLADHRKETHQMKQQMNKMMKDMDPSAMGKDAAPIYRDKHTLKKRDMEEEQKLKEEKERKEALRKQQYDQWGKGMKQSEKQQAQLEDHINEMSKPLARYREDEDLENHLKSKLLSDDPMLAYMMKKQEKMNMGKKSRPVYKGPSAPQNRFNILPGYRWDGVDRSNGYESKLLATRANKMSNEEDAYRWSIQDILLHPEPYTIISIPSPQTIEIDKPCQPENKHATIVNISKVKLWNPVTEDNEENTEPPFPFQEEDDLERCLGVEPNKQASTDSPQVLFLSIKNPDHPTEPLEKLLLVSVDTQTESEPVVSCEVYQRWKRSYKFQELGCDSLGK